MATQPEYGVTAMLQRSRPLRLSPQVVPKPWGRLAGQAGLGDWGRRVVDGGETRIGEIIHHMPIAAMRGEAQLLVKTLFTSQALSVQVHPGRGAGGEAGPVAGKDEAWVVLAAEPGAVIGLGLETDCAPERLRAAALDGSIGALLHWHPCAAGDVFFTPAGTIHAIGAGVTLFEFQQNFDVTYRLYDHGRGRSLQLDEALAVADCSAWAPPAPLAAPSSRRQRLVGGPSFVLERLRLSGGATVRPERARPAWLAVVSGEGHIGGEGFGSGDVWFCEDAAELHGDAELLVAYAGADPAAALWQD